MPHVLGDKNGGKMSPMGIHCTRITERAYALILVFFARMEWSNAIYIKG